MSVPLTKPYLTYDEYLALEEPAPYKSEYVAGEVFAMAGATFEHALITANVTGELSGALRGSGCRAHSSDLRIAVPDSDFAAYPDASVSCGPPEFIDSRRTALINPTVLVEVLSDSTEAYDRGEKFDYYRRLPSLRAYVLVSQRAPLVEVFTRQADNTWLLTPTHGLAAIAAIPALGISLPLAEIYAGVEFQPLPPNRVIPA